MNNSLGSFPPPSAFFKNKVGKVPVVSVKVVHFLTVVKEPKVKADHMELVGLGGSM